MTGLSWRGLGLLVAASLGASCQVIYGLDDYETGLGQPAVGATTGGPGAGGGSTTVGAGGGSCDDSAVTCAPLVAGWDGPFQLFTTAPDAGPDFCGDDSTPVRYVSGPSANGAMCSPCTCGALEASCGIAPVDCYTAAGCTGSGASYTGQLGDGDCGALPIYEQSCKAGAPPVTGASCPPSMVVTMLDPPWQAEHSLCPAKPRDQHCDGEGTCVETGGASALCIVHAGNVASCPAGWDGGQVLTAYAGGEDTRGCSECGCAPEVTCAGGVYHMHGSGTFCTGPPTDMAPGVCVAKQSGWVSYTGATPTGGCAPTGGEPQGAVSVSNETTLCCIEL